MQDFPDVELLGPPRINPWGSPLIWLGVLLLAAYFWLDASRTPGRMLSQGLFTAILIILCAVLIQYMLFAGRDVVLSVEGVRKGKGPRSIFIRWRDANLRYDRRRNRYIVASQGARIVFRYSSFADERRFAEIMGYIRYVIYQQSARQNAQAEKIATPVHGLSSRDKAEFLKYKGEGFFPNVFWPYLAAPIFALCLVYWAFIEVLVHKPPVGPAVKQAINDAWYSFPVLLQRSVAILLPGTFLVGCLVFLWGLPKLLGRRQRKAMRTRWLDEFDRAQVVSLSDIGVQYQDARHQRFLPWNEVPRISRTKGLILFHVVPDLSLSFIVPRRIFAAPKEADDFHRQALAFKRAALTRPSLVSPISFWEIA